MREDYSRFSLFPFVLDTLGSAEINEQLSVNENKQVLVEIAAKKGITVEEDNLILREMVHNKPGRVLF